VIYFVYIKNQLDFATFFETGDLMQETLSFVEASQDRFLRELKEFLAFPSISSSTENSAGIRQCAEWLAGHMRSVGLENVRVMPTAGHPIVYGEWLKAPGKPTILVYGHYDVQPPDPLEEWISPPFQGTVRDGNLFARGAADDKGQLFIHLKAVEAHMRTAGTLPVNLKIVIEGEEEIGSEHLEIFVRENSELLKADIVLVSDSSMFQRGIPSLCYSLRGLAYMQVDLVGPNRDLHSGSFGGAIHNPIQALAEIIASLHDKKGRVTIPGFYRDVLKLSEKERKAFRRLPHSDRRYAESLGVRKLYGEKGFSTLERVWGRPTLECNGIWGGFIGDGAKTVLPAKASAKISMRLVPNQKWEKISALFERHIKKVAPKTVRVSVKRLHGGEPVITPLDSPGVVAAIAALKKGFGKEPLYQREGGSIPIVVKFKDLLGVDSVLLGFGLPDENAHAPNEFISLENFFSGIKTSVHFMREFPLAMNGRKGRR
jgi:acetylornithine deacetylase/succinyl-diaminopimelate desuccinylase-like protein